jgi:hypothetical protein
MHRANRAGRPPGFPRRRPSKITIVATGSTVLTAAVASGVVALWPAAPGVPTADSLTAASASSAQQAGGSLGLEGSETLPTQVLLSETQSAQRRQQSLVVAARLAAARLAAARSRAERLAAARRAQQQAHQSQPSPAPPTSPAPSSPPPSPTSPVPSGSPQQIAMGMLGSYGWSSSQFSCLDPLWNQESGWNAYATNPSSHAYGIPQALPGWKMASAGPDWQTDAATQIRWGLGYIKGTYGSPCGAWAHEQADGWY